mgnify:CR=1 FL=1
MASSGRPEFALVWRAKCQLKPSFSRTSLTRANLQQVANLYIAICLSAGGPVHRRCPSARPRTTHGTRPKGPRKHAISCTCCWRVLARVIHAHTQSAPTPGPCRPRQLGQCCGAAAKVPPAPGLHEAVHPSRPPRSLRHVRLRMIPSNLGLVTCKVRTSPTQCCRVKCNLSIQPCAGVQDSGAPAAQIALVTRGTC